MPSLFKYVPWDTQQLVMAVSMGTVTLPDLQRPFIWPATKVRDLFDSMYRGYPVGQLMFWQTGAETGARQIGIGVKSLVATHAIVDGQQRLTSLFSVMTGEPVVKEDYKASRIKIAFNPFTERFEVATPATDNSSDWLSDITPIFKDAVTAIEDFISASRTAKNLSEDEILSLRRTLARLANLDKYQFTVVDLDKDADEEQVAEIFVRINSEGITLNQADFILTLMSVFWEEGRRDLEAFARSARLLPSEGKPTAFNWHLRPRPEEMLRVVIAVGLNRGTLKNAYSALRGRDIVTGKIDPSRRQEQFNRLVDAQKQVLNLLHWSEFLKCLERAGYRSEKQISSKSAIVFSYAMWIIGRTQFNVPLGELRELIARWFFSTSLTSRYSGSFEFAVDQDLTRIGELPNREPQTFIDHLNTQINISLPNDFWSITLPAALNTSASRSPALFGYIAALNILDADALLATASVRSWLDPALLARKGIERHHLFPKEYLSKKLGISSPRQVNQIANFALVEWSDNIAISDKSPTVYWPEELAKKKSLNSDRMTRQAYWHALPAPWPDIDFENFLTQRRNLMALVIRDAYLRLLDEGYAPTYPSPSLDSFRTSEVSTAHHHVSIRDLLRAGLLVPGTVLVPQVDGIDAIAEVTVDGNILIDGEEFDTPSRAAAATGSRGNGWIFWLADTALGQKTLDQLRRDYIAGDASSDEIFLTI